MFTKPKPMERLRGFYNRFIRLRGNPRQIALGFALGLFIGMSPTMGFQMVVAAFCAALLGWNKWSAAAGVWITNPVTAPAIYALNYWVGAGLLKMGWPEGTAESLEFQGIVSGVLQKTPHVLASLTLGGIVLGAPLAFVGYWAALWAVGRYRGKVKARLESTRQRLREERSRRKVVQSS